MNANSDFELTAEEIAELKALFYPPSYGKRWRYPATFPDFLQLTDPEKIKQCLLNITQLRLVNRDDLRQIPESIQYLKNLNDLDISSCQYITTLPENIVQLKQLEHFKLDCPNLIGPPENIGELVNLRTLSIHHHKITSLPESIGELHKLEELKLFCNQLSTLPEQIGKLQTLSELSLFNCNNLITMPENIGELRQLEKLYILNCSKLSFLPERIGELNQLKELFLACEKLDTLPENIGKLSALQFLTIKSNMIRLPEQIGQLHNLQELNLKDCTHLTTLPESIGKLNNLHTLHIDNCPNLTTLPENLNYLAFGNQKQEEQSDIEMAMKEIDKLIAEFENQTQASTATVQMENGKEVVNLAQFLKELKNHINTDEIKAIMDRQQEPQSPKLTAHQVSAILEKLHKQTAQPAVKIHIQEADNLPLTASKFGGVPYWLPEMPYPVDKQGNKLLLLAQINLSEMPPLPDFPTTGLLQFLMTRNIYAMNFYDNPTRQDDWRVVYHAEINPAIDEAAVLALNIPYTPQIFDEEDDGGFPVDTQYCLSFEPAEIRIGTECIGFNQALKNAAKEVGIKLNKNDLSDLEVLFGEKAWEKIKQHTVENLIGGYPDFTQTDPREERKYKKHSVLLLQIESDEGIMWGDCGVGNFFIRPDDLRKKDFSKVLFHWDCF
ncbi:MAG: DUF1963 domain-containing protein [Neisseriaceae bacterium]|nr:DUF1963 domain-containing protein [Neisseriaceae bacterium]